MSTYEHLASASVRGVVQHSRDTCTLNLRKPSLFFCCFPSCLVRQGGVKSLTRHGSANRFFTGLLRDHGLFTKGGRSLSVTSTCVYKFVNRCALSYAVRPCMCTFANCGTRAPPSGARCFNRRTCFRARLSSRLLCRGGRLCPSRFRRGTAVHLAALRQGIVIQVLYCTCQGACPSVSIDRLFLDNTPF